MFKLSEFIEKITANESLERAVQGKVALSIHGYDFDARELFEIKDVRRWFRVFRDLGLPWFYLLDTKVSGAWLRLDYIIMPKAELPREHSTEDYVWRFSPRKQRRLGLPLEENKRISYDDVIKLIDDPLKGKGPGRLGDFFPDTL